MCRTGFGFRLQQTVLTVATRSAVLTWRPGHRPTIPIGSAGIARGHSSGRAGSHQPSFKAIGAALESQQPPLGSLARRRRGNSPSLGRGADEVVAGLQHLDTGGGVSPPLTQPFPDVAGADRLDRRVRPDRSSGRYSSTDQRRVLEVDGDLAPRRVHPARPPGRDSRTSCSECWWSSSWASRTAERPAGSGCSGRGAAAPGRSGYRNCCWRHHGRPWPSPRVGRPAVVVSICAPWPASTRRPTPRPDSTQLGCRDPAGGRGGRKRRRGVNAGRPQGVALQLQRLGAVGPECLDRNGWMGGATGSSSTSAGAGRSERTNLTWRSPFPTGGSP